MTDNNELLGIEGNFSSIYFKKHFESIGWNNRAPQAREDIPNLLLDIGYTYLFNYVDDWKKTQSTVKNLLSTEYGTGPGGISGNDDAGQMSAWYVFGAVGFYPVCPGSNEYQLSSPVFSRVTFNLDKKYYPGKKFVFEAEPGNNQNSFSKVILNGKEIEPVITHEDLQKGGRLEFLMK